MRQGRAFHLVSERASCGSEPSHAAESARRGEAPRCISPASPHSCRHTGRPPASCLREELRGGLGGAGRELAPPLVGVRPRRCGASPASSQRRTGTMRALQVADLDRAESLAEARRAVLPGLPAARGALHEAPPAEPVSRQARAPARATWSGAAGACVLRKSLWSVQPGQGAAPCCATRKILLGVQCDAVGALGEKLRLCAVGREQQAFVVEQSAPAESRPAGCRTPRWTRWWPRGTRCLQTWPRTRPRRAAAAAAAAAVAAAPAPAAARTSRAASPRWTAPRARRGARPRCWTRCCRPAAWCAALA